jgi:hypothetical protein
LRQPMKAVRRQKRIAPASTLVTAPGYR